MARADDFERLHDAYAGAWEARESGPDVFDHVLIDRLDSLEDDVFNGPGPGRDLVVSLWERGVSPDALEGELVRALPGLARSTFSSLARATVEIIGKLRPEARPDDPTPR